MKTQRTKNRIKGIKIIVVHPDLKQLTEKIVSGDVEELLQVMKATGLEVAYRYENGDILFIDDEGFFKGHLNFFKLDRVHQPLVGTSIIVGIGKNDKLKSAKTKVDETGIQWGKNLLGTMSALREVEKLF